MNQMSSGENTYKLKVYSMRLNELVNYHREQRQVKKEDQSKYLDNSRFTWTPTNFVIMFLQNAVEKHTRTPTMASDDEVKEWAPAREVYVPKLQSWPKFKE